MKSNVRSSRPKRQLTFYIFAAGCLFVSLLLIPNSGIYRAQTDATLQNSNLQTTIAALLNPLLTLTARAFEARTATAIVNIEQTRLAIRTSIAATSLALQTNAIATNLANQTATAPPSPTATLTDTPNPTDVYQTLMADVNRRITQVYATLQTASYLATVDHIALQTLGFTETPTVTLTPSPVITTPTQTPNALEIQQTNVSQRVTQAYATLQTASYLATVDHIALQTLGFTETPIMTLTPSPVITTPTQTPNALEIQQTNVSQRVTQAYATLQTASYLATVDHIALQTLGFTETPIMTLTPSPVITTPTQTPNALEIQQTNVSQRVTQAYATLQTASYLATIDHIALQTLGFTETPLLPTVSPTPNAQEAQQTIQAGVGLSVTQTAQAQTAQAGTANVVATVNSLNNQSLTATAIVQRATLSAGLQLVSADNAASLTTIAVVTGHTDIVPDVVFSPDGVQFASAGADNTIRLWDTVTAHQITVISGVTDRLSVAFSPDGSRLAASSSDGTIRLWDTRTGTALGVLRGHIGRVTSVEFSPDGILLASGGEDKTIRLWNTITLAPPLILQQHTGTVQSVRFSPDGARLASGGADSQLIIWDTVSGTVLRVIRQSGAVRGLAFSPDGSTIVTGGAATVVQDWDIATGRNLRILRGPLAAINSVAVSADGSLIAAAGQDKTIWVWNAATTRLLTRLKGHTGPITSVAFSPDGTRLLSASADTTIHIWGIRQ